MPLMEIHQGTISGIYIFINAPPLIRSSNFPLAPWGEGVT